MAPNPPTITTAAPGSIPVAQAGARNLELRKGATPASATTTNCHLETILVDQVVNDGCRSPFAERQASRGTDIEHA